MKVTIKQSIPDPYKNKDGELVNYTRTETIEGEVKDFEMLMSLINIVTSTFKNVEINIFTTNADNAETKKE